MISSPSNPLIKDVIRLRDKASERRFRGLFIAEGRRMVSELTADRIEALFISEDFDSSSWNGVDLSLPFVQIVSGRVMEKMSDTATPQGILAVAKTIEYGAADVARGGLVILLDRIQDPGNLGTIIRTAEACGADGIICDRGCADPYSPKVIRSAMGAMFRLPVALTDDMTGAVAMLKKAGYTAYAAELKASEDYRSAAWENRSAIMIGNEANGLSGELLKEADKRILIPMQGRVESLNASVAAALLMFEWRRER